MRSAPTRRPPGAARSGALALVAGLSATAVLGLGAAPASAAEGDVAIDVYSINDFHGRLETTSSTAGAAVISGAFQQAKAENPNSTLISAGDNIGASTFTSLSQQDEPTLDALNAMGVSVSTLGNHEFDQGRDDVDGRVTDHSDFPTSRRTSTRRARRSTRTRRTTCRTSTGCASRSSARPRRRCPSS